MASTRSKILFLVGIFILYLAIGIGLRIAANAGLITKLPPTAVEIGGNVSTQESNQENIAANFDAAKSFLTRRMIKENGHIYLYITYKNNSFVYDEYTNSEALSYSLLWAAIEKDKPTFDHQLQFIQNYMIHPKLGYLMWKLNANESTESDGSNIATDADLRTIKAMFLAQQQWGDSKYSKTINDLADALEKVAITNDSMLAPYGGASGESTWTANEVWLSYADFTVFENLAKMRGKPWISVFANMKQATLKAQIYNGLCNSQLTEHREYGNGSDGGGYSINSMWMMIRNAESNDLQLKESAKKSLQFYKQKLSQDNELFALYNSNGDALSPSDTPWVYALVARASIALNDTHFSDALIRKLVSKQVVDKKSQLYGAFPEGDNKVGQFTMQESILALEEYENANKLQK